MENVGGSGSARGAWEKGGEEERPCLIMGIIQANGSVESRVRQIRSPASNVNENVTFLELSITFFFTHPLGFLPFPLGPRLGAFFFLVLLTDDTYLRAVDVSMHVRIL